VGFFRLQIVAIATAEVLARIALALARCAVLTSPAIVAATAAIGRVCLVVGATAAAEVKARVADTDARHAMEARATSIATTAAILRVRRAVVTTIGALQGSTRTGALAIDTRFARLTSGLATATEPRVLCRVNAEVSWRRLGVIDAVHGRGKRLCSYADTLPCLTLELVRGAGVSACTAVCDDAAFAVH